MKFPFQSLKNGFQTEISEEEKTELLDLLQLIDPSDANAKELKNEFDDIVLLDKFFFKILAVLHDKYKDNNSNINTTNSSSVGRYYRITT